MKLQELLTAEDLPEVISDLEHLEGAGTPVTVGAITILKNELAAQQAGDGKQQLLFEQRFELPEGIGERLKGLARTAPDTAGRTARSRLLSDFWLWMQGRDAQRFRDRCDACFWREVVPVIEEKFEHLAEPLMNTINEAILNYAEYSFRPRALRRRVSAHLFRTEADLAYGIVRPSGTHLRPFDPLRLRERRPGGGRLVKRGWGHTLLMRRALFLSFDCTPRRRGLMIVVGPDS